MPNQSIVISEPAMSSSGVMTEKYSYAKEETADEA